MRSVTCWALKNTSMKRSAIDVQNAQSSRIVYLGLPAFNEAEAIQPLFGRISAARTSLISAGLAGNLKVIFYNDGSTDGTVREVRSHAADFEVMLLSPDRNGGLGRALQGIMTFFLTSAAPQDVLVVMDADDTHDPSQIPELLVRMDRDQKDVVIASRYQRGSQTRGVSGVRQFLSVGFALLVKAVLPIKGVRDYSCGYRAYSFESLNRASHGASFRLDETGFAAMPEILVRLRGKNLRFGEIPLELSYDRRLTQSKMRAWQNSFRLLHCVARWRLFGLESRANLSHAISASDPPTLEVLEKSAGQAWESGRDRSNETS